jgi:hypothetical protein
MSTVSGYSNKENELDEVISNVPVRKGGSAVGSRKTFGKFLDNAMNEIRDENDKKMALKCQSYESNSYIGKRCSDEKMYQSGKQTYLY